MFEKLDTNEDGKISRDEFNSKFMEIGLKLNLYY